MCVCVQISSQIQARATPWNTWEAYGWMAAHAATNAVPMPRRVAPRSASSLENPLDRLCPYKMGCDDRRKCRNSLTKHNCTHLPWRTRRWLGWPGPRCRHRGWRHLKPHKRLSITAKLAGHWQGWTQPDHVANLHSPRPAFQKVGSTEPLPNRLEPAWNPVSSFFLTSLSSLDLEP